MTGWTFLSNDGQFTDFLKNDKAARVSNKAWDHDGTRLDIFTVSRVQERWTKYPFGKLSGDDFFELHASIFDPIWIPTAGNKCFALYVYRPSWILEDGVISRGPDTEQEQFFGIFELPKIPQIKPPSPSPNRCSTVSISFTNGVISEAA